MRIIAAHAYHRIDYEVVWATLRDDIPRLESAIKRWGPTPNQPLATLTRFRGAKLGANAARCQPTRSDAPRRSPQLAGSSCDTRRRRQTVRSRLTSGGPEVRTLLRPPSFSNVRAMLFLMRERRIARQADAAKTMHVCT